MSLIETRGHQLFPILGPVQVETRKLFIGADPNVGWLEGIRYLRRTSATDGSDWPGPNTNPYRSGIAGRC